jgi:hypothetical protein
LILSPSGTPTSAVAGQLYFDQARNQLAYFNGSSFVYMLQPSNGTSATNNSVVNNITNNITNGTTNGVTASGGSPGNIALFTSGTTLGSSLINQNGSTVNVAGNFEINGAPLSSSTLADEANLAKRNATQTFTGANTFADATNSPAAFVIQDANGNALWTADTINRVLTAGGNLVVNTPSSCNYNSYTAYVSSLNPLGFWKLEDSGTTAADSSSSNNTGTLSNVTTGITPGPVSCATSHAGMAFNGTNSTITTANTAPGPNTYTQVAMFKTTGGLGTLMGYTNFSGNHDREFGINGSGQLYDEIWNNSLGQQTVTSPGVVNDGNWHIAAATVSAAGMFLYLDGALVASNASFTTPQAYTGSWLMGGEWGVSGAPFTGELAEAAVIPSALNALQVQTLSADSGFYTTNLAGIGIGTSTPGANLDDAGSALFHDSNNSPTAFQVQNKQGDNLLSVDTSSNTVNVGSASASSTTIVQGGTGGVSLNTGAVAGVSGGITIESGASSTTAAGNVNIDTGSSIINGTVVENKTFESGIDNMGDSFGHSDTLATTTAVAHSGTSSLQITEGPFWGNWSIGEGTPYPTNTIIPGHTYRFSAWVRAATVSRSISFSAEFSDDGFGGGGSVGDYTWGTVSDTTTGWTQVSGILVAPVNGFFVAVGATSNGNGGTTGEVHYLDDITVTDLNNLTATAKLNLGTTNAQEVNLGNANQTGTTSVYGTGLNFEAGLGYITEAGGFFTLSGTQGGNISTSNGPLTMTSATSASWGISGSSGTGGDLTLHGGQGGNGNNGGNLILESGAGNGAGSSGNVQITTPSGTGTSGAISIQSGNSSTTAAGNVNIDTGNSTVNGVQVEALDFESGTENMNMWGGSGSVTQDCTQAHTGSCSLNITGFSSVSAWENGGDSGWAVSPGHTYAFSFWVKAASTAESVSGAVSWHMTNGDWTWSGSPTITDTSTGWTQVTWTATAPAGAQFGDFELGNINGPGTTHYFDDVVATDMSSGSSFSSLNLGTANAQGVTIGNISQINPTTIYGGGITLAAGQGNLAISGGATTITASGQANIKSTGGDLVLSGAGGSNPGVVVTPGADSTEAFNVQSAGGTSLINVDSTNSAVSLGSSTSTIGYATVATNAASGNSEWLEAQKFTTTSAGGTLHSISVYFGSADSAPNNKFAAALYSDSGAACNGGVALASCPATMITSSADTTVTSFGWDTAALSASLSPNTSYWLVMNTYASAGNLNNTYADPNPAYDYASDSGVPLDTWPTFGAPTFTGHSALSMYANVSTGVDGSALTTNVNGGLILGGGSGSTGYAVTVNSPGPGTGALSLQGATYINSASPYALQVVQNGGGEMFDVDTQNGRVLIGGLDTHWGGAYSAGTLDVRTKPGLEAVSITDAGGNPIFSVGGDGSTLITTQTNSAQAFRVQDATSNPLLVADTSGMNITVSGTATKFATLTLTNAHFASTQTTKPTISVPSNCGTTPSAQVTSGSTDAAGSFTISAGSGAPTTCDTVLSFNQPYGSAPKSIILTPALGIGGATISTDARVSATGASSFTTQTVSPAASGVYSYYYWVVQ